MSNIVVKPWDAREGELGAGILVIADTIRTSYKIVRGPYGPFVSYPSYKNSAGKFVEYAGPVSKEARQACEKAIFKAHKINENSSTEQKDSGTVKKIKQEAPFPSDDDIPF